MALKLLAAAEVRTDFYLTLDADLVATRRFGPRDLFFSGGGRGEHGGRGGEGGDGQAEHAVRSSAVPPDVDDPAGHVEQLVALLPLNMLSAPQGAQVAASAVADVPARHGAHEPAPSSETKPSGQAVHALAFAGAK